MFWRRRRLRKGLATLHAAARMRQSLKGTFARQRLRLTRQAFWKWQLCVFVHGGVHTPVWEVLGGRRVASRPSRRSYARRHLSKLRQAVNAEDSPAAKCRLVSMSGSEGARFLPTYLSTHSPIALSIASGRACITIVEYFDPAHHTRGQSPATTV